MCLLAFMLGLLPSAALAHGGEDHDNAHDAVEVLLNGFYHLAPDQTAGTVVVINDDALIEGTVEDFLVIVNGDAVLTGTVEGGVFVVNGSLALRELAVVEDDVILVRSTLTQEPATRVQGDIDTRSGWFLTGGAGFLVGFVLWVWFAATALLVAVVVAAVAGRQLLGAVTSMAERPGPTWLAVLLLWAVGGTAVTALFATVIGIGAALTAVLLFLPVLLLLGFVVAGTWLGRFVVGLFDKTPDPDHPYAAAVAGVGLLALVALIPVVGALVGGLATLWGTGAIGYQAWRSFRGPTPPEASVEAVSLS